MEVFELCFVIASFLRKSRQFRLGAIYAKKVFVLTVFKTSLIGLELIQCYASFVV